MRPPVDRVRRRAERFTACYPPVWRARYGEEFVELLVAEYLERPRSVRRTLDVLGGAALARARSAGLAAGAGGPPAQIRAGLVALGCALAAFLAAGFAMWSQVAVGWRWEPPGQPAVTVAMVAMTAAALVVGVVVILAAAPMTWLVARALIRGHRRRLVGPALLAAAGASILMAGSRHFGQGWPGFGGHSWAYQGLVPSGVAALCWGATLAFTAYWAHPAALQAFPTAEILWMVVSPVAAGAFVIGAAKIVRRVELPDRVVRYELALADVLVATMVVFLAGAACWVLSDGPPGPTGIYRVGVIDLAGLAVMGLASLSAVGAVRCARAAGPA